MTVRKSKLLYPCLIVIALALINTHALAQFQVIIGSDIPATAVTITDGGVGDTNPEYSGQA